MIQRIQSLYLSLSVMLISLMLYGKIVSFVDLSGTLIEMRFNGFFLMTSQQGEKIEALLPLTLLLVLIPVLLFATLLLYKFRKLQMRSSVLAILLLIGLVIITAYFIFYAVAKYEATIILSIKVVFTPVAAILAYMAFRGILRDELLMRSYERLR